MYRVLYERSCTLLLSQSALKQLLWESLTDQFYQNNLLQHCISAEYWLMENYVQVALRKELDIAPFVERF